MITVRMAQPSDIPQINVLLKQILVLHAEQRPDIFKFDREKYTVAELEELLKDPQRPCIVADDDGLCVGYALCKINPPVDGTSLVPRLTVYLDDLCIDKNRRGESIGKLLMDAVTEFSQKLGADAIELNVWESNEGARRFYERYGFTTQRRHMELPLNKLN